MNIELAPSALSRSLKNMNLDLSSAYTSEVLGVMGADVTGKLGFVNPTAAKLIKIFAWELIGRDIHEFLQLDKQEVDSEWPQDSAQGNSAQAIPMIRIIDRDGKVTRNLTAFSSSVFDESDQVCGTLVFFCKLSDTSGSPQLFNQLVQLDHLIRKLRQEKLRLVTSSIEESVISSKQLVQVIRSVETLESSVNEIMQMFFKPNTSLR